MQTGEETATAEEPILEEGSGREQVREGRSARLFAVSQLSFFFFLFLARKLCMDSTRRLQLPKTTRCFPARSVAKHAFGVFGAGGSHVFSPPLLTAWCQCKGTKQQL